MKFYRSILLSFLLLSHCETGDATLRDVPESAKKNLLIENFANHSVEGEKWMPWQIGFPDMIEDDFVSTGFFRVSTTGSRVSSFEEQKFGQLGVTSESTEMGAMLAAAWVVRGSFIVSGDFIVIKASVTDVKTAQVIASKMGKAPLKEFYSALKQVSTGLLRSFRYDLTENEIQSIAKRVETQSYAASLSNYRGEMYLHEAQQIADSGSSKVETLNSLARTEFKKALDADPDYEKAKKNLAKLSLMLPSSI